MTADAFPAVVELLRQKLALDDDLIAVWLFGSMARGEARPHSDVDLGFLARRRVEPLAVFDVAQDVAMAIGRDVDLVDLDQVGTVLRAQVVGRGRRLFASDTLAADTFEMHVLSDYARLNEERRDVLQAFVRGVAADDVVSEKAATIGRSVQRVRDEFRGDPRRLDDQTVEDAVVLNLLHATEASIDIAMGLVARERLGLPQETRDAFRLIEAAGAIPAKLSLRLQHLVGFRDMVVHADEQLSPPILVSIVQTRLGDVEEFARTAVARRA